MFNAGLQYAYIDCMLRLLIVQLITFSLCVCVFVLPTKHTSALRKCAGSLAHASYCLHAHRHTAAHTALSRAYSRTLHVYEVRPASSFSAVCTVYRYL